MNGQTFNTLPLNACTTGADLPVRAAFGNIANSFFAVGCYMHAVDKKRAARAKQLLRAARIKNPSTGKWF
jgi:hypothetical protein